MARKTLGKYEIIERIGRGGMAEVYRGYHASLDRYVAIKLLHPFLADDPEFKTRFEKEAKNVAKLRHPNIVQVFDFEYDQNGESYYMVMELINGPTLKDKLFEMSTNHQEMSLEQTAYIVSGTASALAYAHKRNMIHRDVKPANLMLDEDGRVVLTDFGIAKIVTGVQFTASGGMVGTPAYMAPEQGLGEAGDERSDIYSLGVIFYQLVTGELPYDADTPLAVILQHLNEPVPDLSKVAPDTPPWAVSIIRKAMEKDADRRYQTADEFLADLHAGFEKEFERPSQLKRPAGFPAIAEGLSDPTSTPTPGATSGKLETGNTQTERVVEQTRGDRPVMTTGGRRVTSTMTGSIRNTKRGKGDNAVLSIAAILFVMSVVLLIGLIGAGFSGSGPLASIFSPTDTPAEPTSTTLAGIDDTETPSNEDGSPTEISSHTPTFTYTATFTETATFTPTPTFTDTATFTYTPSFTPTDTYTPTETDTPTPVTPTATATRTPSRSTQTAQARQTATFEALQTLNVASPTPDALDLLARCDLNYVVIEPSNLQIAPSVNATTNDRLVRARDSFEYELVIENASTCLWPEEGELELFFLVDTLELEYDYTPHTENCGEADRIFTDVNFTDPQRPRYFIPGEIKRAEQTTLIITGEAASSRGCYFGFWQLQFASPDLDDPIIVGEPFLMAIQVYGGN